MPRRRSRRSRSGRKANEPDGPTRLFSRVLVRDLGFRNHASDLRLIVRVNLINPVALDSGAVRIKLRKGSYHVEQIVGDTPFEAGVRTSESLSVEGLPATLRANEVRVWRIIPADIDSNGDCSRDAH